MNCSSLKVYKFLKFKFNYIIYTLMLKNKQTNQEINRFLWVVK